MPAMTREELLWRKLEDEMAEELIEQAASVSVAQAEKELAEAGFDVAAERARAEGFLASLEAGIVPGAEAAPAPSAAKAAAQVALDEAAKAARKQADGGDRKKRPVALWLAAAAATVTAGAAVAYVETRPEEGTPPSPATPSTVSPSPSPDPLEQARELRRQAAVACKAGRPENCLGLLDDAANKDPAGDTREDVRALRKQAEDEMRRNEAKPK